MRTKKPKRILPEKLDVDNAIIFHERIIAETGNLQLSILKAINQHLKEIDLRNLFHDVDSQRFRCRLSALEKAESERQAHEVTK